MFCRNCGNQVKSGAKFCGKCGHPVASVPVAAAQNAQPAFVSAPIQLDSIAQTVGDALGTATDKFNEITGGTDNIKQKAKAICAETASRAKDVVEILPSIVAADASESEKASDAQPKSGSWMRVVAALVIVAVAFLFFTNGANKQPATLQEYLNQHPQELQQIQSAANETAAELTNSTLGIIGAQGSVSVKGNQLTVTITTSLNVNGLVSERAADIFNLIGGDRLLGSLLSNGSNNASTAQMIQELENELGINGITMRFVVADSQGFEICSQTWSNRGLI